MPLREPFWNIEAAYTASALMNRIPVLSPEKIILGGEGGSVSSCSRKSGPFHGKTWEPNCCMIIDPAMACWKTLRSTPFPPGMEINPAVLARSNLRCNLMA